MRITSSKQLSNYVKDSRKRCNLSQSTIAKKVGIKQDTVSKFELDADTTRLETLFKILSALNLDIEIKQRGSNDPENSWSEDW